MNNGIEFKNQEVDSIVFEKVYMTKAASKISEEILDFKKIHF